MRHLIVLSGPIGVGKTALAKFLAERFHSSRLSTRQLLIDKGIPDERGALQDAGEQLDRETDGAWVAEGVRAAIRDLPQEGILLLDSVRISKQIGHLRDSFRGRVLHVHLTATDETLSRRYLERDHATKEFATYQEVRKSGTEAQIESLAALADVVIDTDRNDTDAVVARAVARLGLYPKEIDRLVDVIVGGQYGSEGKGNICAHIAREYDVLMRVGGPNAGHRVASPPFKYVQLPSGTGSNPDATILVGAGATIWVPTILDEIEKLKLTPRRLAIDPQAMIIEESDREYESRTLDVIGSTKQGVGAATARKILGRDSGKHLGSAVRLAKNIEKLLPFVRDTKVELENAYASQKKVMLEGTQGTDLSIHHAKYPHVTSRETTASGCLADAGIAPLRVRKVVMVTRTYPIRVGGTSGDLPGEISFEIVAEQSKLPVSEIRATEVGTVSGKQRRIAEFNWEQLRRSSVLNGATDIALTFADYLDARNKDANRFEQLSTKTKEFIAEVERVSNANVSMISARFDARGIIDRRNWK
jgi:adenylosuccinate synthase